MNTPLRNPDVAELEEKIKRLKFALQSSDVRMYMGRFLKDIIYRRVKSGKGVSSESSENPSSQKLKALSPAYIKYRKSLSGTTYTVRKGSKSRKQKSTSRVSRVPTGEFFSPARSNITLTGQLLNSIVEGTTLNGFKIFIPDTTRNGSKLTNAKLYEYVSKDRPFFALTNGEFRILQNEFEKIVEQKIQVIFGK